MFFSEFYLDFTLPYHLSYANFNLLFVQSQQTALAIRFMHDTEQTEKSAGSITVQTIRDNCGDHMKKKIIIVDDEKMIRNMLETAFTREGYDVICAESAEEALEILPTFKAQVMFLDLKLPGMDGMDLCKTIRELYPMSIVYAITGYASLYELSDCRRVGFEDYFTKPVDLKTLFKAATDSFEKIQRWEKS